MRNIFLVLLVLFLFCIPTLAQDSLNVQRIGDLELDLEIGSLEELAYSDGYVYIAADWQGIIVIDVSDPTSPSLVTTIESMHTTDVDVCGNYLFVADQYTGLIIFDISNPAAPSEVGRYEISGQDMELETLAEHNGYAYLGVDGYGVVTVNVNDPSSPTFVYEYTENDHASEIVTCGNCMYNATGSVYLCILDISDPDNPSPDCLLPIATVCGWVDVQQENLVYTGVLNPPSDFGIRAIDITDREAPVEVSFIALSTYNFHFQLNGNYLVANDGMNGIRIFDISNPSSPSEYGYFIEPRDSGGFTTWGNLIYTIYDDYFAILQVEGMTEIRDPVSPTIPAEYTLMSVYPNPFNSLARVQFNLQTSSMVTIHLYNNNGRFLEQLLNTSCQPGVYTIPLDCRCYSSGVYYIRMKYDGQEVISRAFLVR